MFKLSESELKEIFEKAYRQQPENLLEFSMILSGKCRIENYTFPAPTLGSYILLHEWKSPFEGENSVEKRNEKSGENREKKSKEKDILLEDLYMALFILENGRQAAESLMEKRFEKFSGKKEEICKISLPYRMLENVRKKYPFKDPARAAEDLENILSLHSAIDMLPDEWETVSAGKFIKKLDTKNYSSWMENICGLIFAFQELLPLCTYHEILWKIPLSFLGFLLVRQCRKNNVSGVEKEDVSRILWQEFSRKMEEKMKEQKLNGGVNE